MSNSIEDIFYEAHKLGKREALLESIPSFRRNHPSMRLKELYEKAFEKIKKQKL